jgi:anthranilate synthase component 2
MLRNQSLLIIDNFDSFTYNLVQLVEEAWEGTYRVVREDKLSTVNPGLFDRILISPGPGSPAEFPGMCNVIRDHGRTKKMLGVCLGHQAIATVYGGRLLNLKRVNHGVTTGLHLVCTDESLFHGIGEDEQVGLYHSWEVDPETLPACLEVTARSDDGNILAIRHKSFSVKGIQFHPESIMTKAGMKILENWFHA